MEIIRGLVFSFWLKGKSCDIKENELKWMKEQLTTSREWIEFESCGLGPAAGSLLQLPVLLLHWALFVCISSLSY